MHPRTVKKRLQYLNTVFDVYNIMRLTTLQRYQLGVFPPLFAFSDGRRFLSRDAMHSADYAVARCLSVCPSHAGILSKQLNISSNVFTR